MEFWWKRSVDSNFFIIFENSFGHNLWCLNGNCYRYLWLLSMNRNRNCNWLESLFISFTLFVSIFTFKYNFTFKCMIFTAVNQVVFSYYLCDFLILYSELLLISSLFEKMYAFSAHHGEYKPGGDMSLCCSCVTVLLCTRCISLPYF